MREKFFQAKVISGAIKYSAFNGVLTALYYNPLSFNARLLVGLQHDVKIKNLSYSYCKSDGPDVKESMFIMSFSEELKINLTFNSCNVYYVETTELTKEILENLQQSIRNLYLHSLCQTDRKLMVDPKKLLKNLNKCIEKHSTLVKEYPDSRDIILQGIPEFVESLTKIFSEEEEKLNLIAEDIEPKVVLSQKN